jgi:hypothetical protein
MDKRARPRDRDLRAAENPEKHIPRRLKPVRDDKNKGLATA